MSQAHTYRGFGEGTFFLAQNPEVPPPTYPIRSQLLLEKLPALLHQMQVTPGSPDPFHLHPDIELSIAQATVFSS